MTQQLNLYYCLRYIFCLEVLLRLQVETALLVVAATLWYSRLAFRVVPQVLLSFRGYLSRDIHTAKLKPTRGQMRLQLYPAHKHQRGTQCMTVIMTV